MVGLMEDVLKSFIAETLGITKFDDAEFEKRIAHIDVLSASEMVFHFKDGGTVQPHMGAAETGRQAVDG